MADDYRSGLYSYSLTEFTGRRRNDYRTQHIGRKEVNQQLFYAGLIGALPGLALTGILAVILIPLFGTGGMGWSALGIPVGVLGGIYLLYERDELGSGARRYQAMTHRYLAKRSTIGRIYIRGEQLVEPQIVIFRSLTTTTPFERIESQADEDLFATRR